LLVTMARIPYTYTPLCYLLPLPAWVCMSMRLPLFSIVFVCFSVHIPGADVFIKVVAVNRVDLVDKKLATKLNAY